MSWKFKLNLALKSKGLYEVATGVKVRPAGESNSTDVVNWTKLDLEAQTLIGLNVDSRKAAKIANCTSSFQMTAKLETLFGKKSDVTIEGMREEFFSFKYDENQSVVDNCLRVQQLADNLKAEGDEIKEGWIMTRTLSMLPPKLRHFRTSWDCTTAADKNLTALVEKLQLEEDRLNKNTEGDESNSRNALLSSHHNKIKNSQSKGNGKSNKPLTCYKCDQPGHLKKDCKNKPCAKYLEFCKNKYSCNVCQQKGHFAKDCPSGKGQDKKTGIADEGAYACISKSSSLNSEHSESENDSGRLKLAKLKKNKVHAYFTISLSAGDIKYINSTSDRVRIWYQDCGATRHMTSHRDLFTNYCELNNSTFVIIGDATELKAFGRGDIMFEAHNGEAWRKIILKNVLHVPDMPFNLFSVVRMLDRGHTQVADSKKSEFYDVNGNVVIMAMRDGDLFQMKFRELESEDQEESLRKQATENCMMSVSIKVWHERLAHQNVRHTREVLNNNGIVYVDDWGDYVCEGCAYGKQHRVPHPMNPKRAEEPLQLIHVDLGEMNVRSLGGAKYFLLFKDDYTHYRTVYFLKTKDEAVKKLDVFVRLVENQFDKRIKSFRSDNGTEIKNGESRKILEELGIFHSFTSTYTPQQNGRIEREMRTVVEAARSSLHAQGLSDTLWAEAMNYAVFTLNQTGTSSVREKSPAQLWFGRQLGIEKLRVFGTRCYVLIEDRKRRKIDKKSEPGIFVGYDLNSPDYRIYVTRINDVVQSVNVLFDEISSIKQSQIKTCVTVDDEKSKSEPESENYDSDGESDTLECLGQNDIYTAKKDSDESVPKVETITRSLRDRSKLKRPDRYGMYADKRGNLAMIGEVVDIPIDEAMEDKSWRGAIMDEYDSLVSMGTWKLIQPPPHIRPLTNKWILRVK